MLLAACGDYRPPPPHTAFQRLPVSGSLSDARFAGFTDCMTAYNLARLKTLNGLTPYKHIAKVGKSEPDRFSVNPIHQLLGLNT